MRFTTLPIRPQQVLRVFGILLLAGAGTHLPAQQSARQSSLLPGGFRQYRNKNRVLLIFAPSVTDVRYARFSGSLERREMELKDREIVRFDVLQSGVSKRDGAMLSADEAGALRHAFHASGNRFKVVVLDKDGSRMPAAGRAVTASEVLAAIDATPLRRYEARSRGKAGSTASAADVLKPGTPQPSKRLTPDQVVKIQMEALQHNDTPKPDAGIATTFDFASPQNKQATGPLDHFTLIVKSPGYLPMLNCKKITYDPVIIDGDSAQQRVHIVAADGSKIAYVFLLSLQKDGPFAGCWMNDGCVRDDSDAERHQFDA